MKLYTIGHSAASLASLIESLSAYDVAVLVDVRSKPRSRLAHFDQYPLHEALDAAGIAYAFKGDELGGMPRDPRIAERWRQGHLDHVIVAHLRDTDEWHDGLNALAALVRRADGPICLMCSEADPNECHRKAVALDLAARCDGLTVEHLSIASEAPQEVGVQELLL
jgi:uncharacterized protein (DUF488 family)